mmetsp:Transcript_6236/g.7584  ORF Transcript_6236/g.7584 Transcript_6236/m.7584 type:complete len:575 (+) Transcript_6236:49-1773(+)
MSVPAGEGLSKELSYELNRFQRLAKFKYDPIPWEKAFGKRDKTGGPDSILGKLYGPMYKHRNVTDLDVYQKLKYEAADEFWKSLLHGDEHHMYYKYQKEGAKSDDFAAADVRGQNVAVVRMLASQDEPNFLTSMVIINNPEDAARIARLHVKKAPNFTPQLFDSIISTQNNQYWGIQRDHFVEIFLPKKSLAQIFPTSLARAQKCCDKMDALRKASGEYGVQVHDFFLHEAQAQLQMALFGMDEEFMEKTNKGIRDAFAGINPDMEFAKNMCLEMLDKVGSNPNFSVPSEEEVVSGKKPVFGPLSKIVYEASNTLDMNLKDQFGNMMLILFAGHDTTGHTMTWLTYELAKHPEYQQKLHQEVDQFFKDLNGRDPVYEDCEKLPFLTRCVMETLRLWPAVLNGTFRQLQYNEEIVGPGGKPVALPKGTYVQIPNWSRHRSKNLWGEDAEEFNPMREFSEDEVWGGHFKGYNPASKRFSPFTFQPRDCLGKNFAQMEMRMILAHLFHKFSFSLSEPYKQWNSDSAPLENNQGTSGPRDLTPEGLEESRKRKADNRADKLGMWLIVNPRTPGPSSKL